MVSILYSVIVGLCSLFLITILINSISVAKSTESGKVFIIFLFFAIIFSFLDFLWGICFSVCFDILMAKYIITYINLFAFSGAVFGWVIFSFSFLGRKLKRNKQLLLFFILFVMQCVYLLIDILNGNLYKAISGQAHIFTKYKNFFFFIHFINFFILSIIVFLDLIKEKSAKQKIYVTTILTLALIPLFSTVAQNYFITVPVYTMGITLCSLIVYSRIITYEASQNLANYQSMKCQLEYQKRERRDLAIITSLSGQFDFVVLLNYKENIIKPLRISGVFKNFIDASKEYFSPEDFDGMLKSIVLEETFQDFLSNVDRNTIMPILNNGERVSIEFASNESCDFHHYKISFVKDLDSSDIVLVGIKNIEKEFCLRKEIETQKSYITTLKAEHDFALYMASIDGLTGLLNKISFIDKVEQYIRRNTSINCALIFFDMDHFKSVNDVFGHDKGDEALKNMSKRLKTMFRTDEIIGRMGGDEFSIFLPNISKDVLEKRLQDMNENLKDVYTNSAVTIKTSVSVGCVYCVEKTLNYKDLHQIADKTMYEVKNSGRNNFIIKEV